MFCYVVWCSSYLENTIDLLRVRRCEVTAKMGWDGMGWDGMGWDVV